MGHFARLHIQWFSRCTESFHIARRVWQISQGFVQSRTARKGATVINRRQALVALGGGAAWALAGNVAAAAGLEFPATRGKRLLKLAGGPVRLGTAYDFGADDWRLLRRDGRSFFVAQDFVAGDVGAVTTIAADSAQPGRIFRLEQDETKPFYLSAAGMRRGIGAYHVVYGNKKDGNDASVRLLFSDGAHRDDVDLVQFETESNKQFLTASTDRYIYVVRGTELFLIDMLTDNPVRQFNWTVYDTARGEFGQLFSVEPAGGDSILVTYSRNGSSKDLLCASKFGPDGLAFGPEFAASLEEEEHLLAFDLSATPAGGAVVLRVNGRQVVKGQSLGKLLATAGYLTPVTLSDTVFVEAAQVQRLGSGLIVGLVQAYDNENSGTAVYSIVWDGLGRLLAGPTMEFRTAGYLSALEALSVGPSTLAVAVKAATSSFQDAASLVMTYLT